MAYRRYLLPLFITLNVHCYSHCYIHLGAFGVALLINKVALLNVFFSCHLIKIFTLVHWIKKNKNCLWTYYVEEVAAVQLWNELGYVRAACVGDDCTREMTVGEYLALTVRAVWTTRWPTQKRFLNDDKKRSSSSTSSSSTSSTIW